MKKKYGVVIKQEMRDKSNIFHTPQFSFLHIILNIIGLNSDKVNNILSRKQYEKRRNYSL